MKQELSENIIYLFTIDEQRFYLAKELELPEHLTANGLLEAMNLLLSREEFDRL